MSTKLVRLTSSVYYLLVSVLCMGFIGRESPIVFIVSFIILGIIGVVTDRITFRCGSCGKYPFNPRWLTPLNRYECKQCGAADNLIVNMSGLLIYVRSIIVLIIIIISIIRS